MKKGIVSIATIGVTLNFLLAGTASSEEVEVKYPEGYRKWTHVKSMVIQSGHPLYGSFGGIHHIYANYKALRSMINGGAYPDGSVLVFDLLEAKSENSAIVEGDRKVLGVMEKDSEKFNETGGWGFEGFKGDTRERVVTDAKGACFSCHEPQKASDYVYSIYRRQWSGLHLVSGQGRAMANEVLPNHSRRVRARSTIHEGINDTATLI